MTACHVPFDNNNLDTSFFVFRPTVVQVDDLIEALKQFSLYTQSLGGVHSSILRSIHGNMIVWYGAWKKRTDDNKRQLSASLLSMLAKVASMAILIDHAFCDPLAGESGDGSPAVKIVTGDIISLSSIGPPPSYQSSESTVSSFARSVLKDRYHKISGAKAVVLFKSKDSPRFVGLLLWKSLHLCYEHLITSGYRKQEDFRLDVKYDVFRVICVYVREEEEEDAHERNKEKNLSSVLTRP